MIAPYAKYGSSLEMVNAKGGSYGTALQAACSRLQSPYLSSNIPRAASSSDYENVMQMLLDQGADVNAQGGEYGNALQAASFKGHEKVVQMLLDHGADAIVNRSTVHTR